MQESALRYLWIYFSDMLKINCCSLIVAASLFVFSCATPQKNTYKRLKGKWQATPITIDGNNKDWPSPYPEYDENASLGYAISNDTDNLYITVETGDLATQQKILKEGLTVWIDKTGQKEEKTAINFPLPYNVLHPAPKSEKSSKGEKKERKGDRPSAEGSWKTVSSGAGNGSTNRRFAMEDEIKSMLEQSNEYSLQGFKACNLQFPLSENDSCGIKVRLSINDNNEMIWEAVIPFKSFYYKKRIDKRDKGKPMSVCIETTGTKRPPDQNNGAGGTYGGNGVSFGMGSLGLQIGANMINSRYGRNGGGSHTGSQGVQDPSMSESLYKSTKTWKKFGIGWYE
jgi:hypothetical protein